MIRPWTVSRQEAKNMNICTVDLQNEATDPRRIIFIFSSCLLLCRKVPLYPNLQQPTNQPEEGSKPNKRDCSQLLRGTYIKCLSHCLPWCLQKRWQYFQNCLRIRPSRTMELANIKLLRAVVLLLKWEDKTGQGRQFIRGSSNHIKLCNKRTSWKKS